MNGCLRSATLMPGGLAFDSAVAVAKHCQKLGVGIHFTLVNGYPILPPEEIPSLVNDEGVFWEDHTVFVKRLLTGHIRLSEVRAELEAQLRKVEQAGLRITHADSHQHMHTLPGILDIVLDLSQAAGIRAVRVPRTPIFCGEFGGIGQLVGRLGLGTLARVTACKAKRRGMAVPDHFAGIVAGEAVSEIYLTNIVCRLQPGVTEVMMHPGTDNSVLIPDCGWDHDFEAELMAIVSPAVLKLAAEEQVEFINFGSLYAEG